MSARDTHYDRRVGPSRRVQLEGVAKQALDVGHVRLIAVAAGFALCFLVIAGRLIGLTALAPQVEGAAVPNHVAAAPVAARAEIFDRNGVLLAGNVQSASLFANPGQVLDASEAAELLAAVLPEFDVPDLIELLSSERRFVWLKRHLSPNQQDAVNRLGIPGLGFVAEERRVYPHGALAAHVVGFTSVDREGLGGLEKGLDEDLAGGQSARLSLDVRVQHAVRAELAASVEEFRAIGAAAIVMDVRSGEIVSMVSLPDFDPGEMDGATKDARFNRATLGVYEMGSTFKAFTTAAALEYGVADLDDTFDASALLRVARFTINADHPKNRWLSVAEIFQYSSNIGSARMALEIGRDRQRAFLASLGLLDRPSLELPEVGTPMVPKPWREISTMTIAYGHGVAVSPIQLVAAYAPLVNGGLRVTPTLLARGDDAGDPVRVLSEKTSHTMRALLGLVVEDGTGKNAQVQGYLVGGKTGTAEKAGAGGYRRHALLSSFVGAFPISNPRYVVFAVLDEPKGTEATFNFASAGWTAAPTVGRIVARIAPLLGVAPVHEDEEERSGAVFVSAAGRR